MSIRSATRCTASKALLLKDASLSAVSGDMLFLGVFATVALLIATPLFKRTL